MKIEIKVGNTSTNKRVALPFEKLDNIDSEKKRMYDFLINCKDCIIENVDNFLLYTLNNGIMAYIVKDNVELHSDEYNENEYHLIPKFNPEIYKVFEIKEDGTEISLQDDDGNIGKNYFNILMGSVMDDYYNCLTSTKLQTKHKSSITTEIENNQPEKWLKIFAPMWTDGKGNTVRYEISYIRADELHKVIDYKILEEYSDRGTMLNAL